MVVLTRLGPPEQGVRHTQSDTDVFINERLLGSKGKLYISEARISWVGPNEGQGFSLEYPHVAMHAVKRADAGLAASTMNRDCLYLVLDVRLVDSDDTGTPSSTPGASDNDSDGGGDPDDDGGITEIRCVGSLCFSVLGTQIMIY